MASIGAITLISCTSTPKGPQFHKTEVIERQGGREATPEWAIGEVAMKEDAGKVIFINTTQMAGDARPEMCIKAAEETGRANMMRYIKDNITTSGQLSEQDVSSDPAVENLTAFLSQGKLSGASIGRRYWEKVVVSNAQGHRELKLRCAAQVQISRSTLQKQLRDAVSGAKGNPEIRQQLLDAQKKFIDGLSAQ